MRLWRLMNRRTSGKRQTKRRRRSTAALAIAAVGLVLLITAAVLEAIHYPWERLLGLPVKSVAAMAAPSPIQLDKEDQGVKIVSAPPSYFGGLTAGDASSLSPSATVSTPAPSAANLPGAEQDTQSAAAPDSFVVFGTLKIPALDVSQNLLEGDGREMKYGVGHVPGTALPGSKGNCAIAGHRPYPFRYLDQLSAGDTIVIEAGDHACTYTVYDSFDVLPTEVWVLYDIPGETSTLTLITCTPYTISSHRLIVRARLTEVNGKTPEAYFGVSAAPSPLAPVSPSVAAPTLVPSPSASASGAPSAPAPTVTPAPSTAENVPQPSELKTNSP